MGLSKGSKHMVWFHHWVSWQDGVLVSAYITIRQLSQPWICHTFKLETKEGFVKFQDVSLQVCCCNAAQTIHRGYLLKTVQCFLLLSPLSRPICSSSTCKYYEPPYVSSDIEAMPLKKEVLQKSTPFTESMMVKHLNVIKWRRRCGRKCKYPIYFVHCTFIQIVRRHPSEH